MPTAAEIDRILAQINYGHIAFAIFSLVMVVWAFATGVGTNMRIGAIFSFSMFTGLYFYTRSVRRTLTDPLKSQQKQE
ncbi:MAG: hypothetical protein WCF85_07280 [Rhodospirillaceae bacterium]